MKAIFNTIAGDPHGIQIKETTQPQPEDNQVLVQVAAVALNVVDMTNFKNYYKTNSVKSQTKLLDKLYVHGEGKILGADFAGTVKKVGKNVRKFKIGDAVMGISDDYLNGSWAEYIAFSESNVVLKPERLSFEEAAAIPTTGGTALTAIEKADIQSGQNILINGATGGVGLYALQITKALGAKVTAVVSGRNAEFVRKYGADKVVDYHQVDITQDKNETTFDVIVAINGYHPLYRYKKMLDKQGNYVAIGGVKQAIAAMLLGKISTIGSQKQMGAISLFSAREDWLANLQNIINQSDFQPYLDRVFSWQDVDQAMAYGCTQHLKGKVVMKID
ncbi:NAD(P)-dependent alcohol dehydrogenase [Weissella fangxianensis]|uniref:NAD(P)-dependent alcohol dehydrogenase n=1 Tax=Weissella fangxianensis TaxID=2953879 RepID=UPI0021579AAE|nr:NAD(P)-dependent alcohol dehydrogenase [Weissella fangxianensis]